MSLGPGKYDEFCTILREETAAAGAIIVVLEGNRGSGFSVQLSTVHMQTVPSLLRYLADQIEADFKKGLL